MRKISFGLFGLCMILGSTLGGMFGVAISLCAWMVLDGIIEEIQKRPIKTKIEGKKE